MPAGRQPLSWAPRPELSLIWVSIPSQRSYLQWALNGRLLELLVSSIVRLYNVRRLEFERVV
jgi:hypothetical protein